MLYLASPACTSQEVCCKVPPKFLWRSIKWIILMGGYAEQMCKLKGSCQSPRLSHHPRGWRAHVMRTPLRYSWEKITHKAKVMLVLQHSALGTHVRRAHTSDQTELKIPFCLQEDSGTQGQGVLQCSAGLGGGPVEQEPAVLLEVGECIWVTSSGPDELRTREMKGTSGATGLGLLIVLWACPGLRGRDQPTLKLRCGWSEPMDSESCPGVKSALQSGGWCIWWMRDRSH